MVVYLMRWKGLNGENLHVRYLRELVDIINGETNASDKLKEKALKCLLRLDEDDLDSADLEPYERLDEQDFRRDFEEDRMESYVVKQRMAYNRAQREIDIQMSYYGDRDDCDENLTAFERAIRNALVDIYWGVNNIALKQKVLLVLWDRGLLENSDICHALGSPFSEEFKKRLLKELFERQPRDELILDLVTDDVSGLTAALREMALEEFLQANELDRGMIMRGFRQILQSAVCAGRIQKKMFEWVLKHDFDLSDECDVYAVARCLRVPKKLYRDYMARRNTNGEN